MKHKAFFSIIFALGLWCAVFVGLAQASGTSQQKASSQDAPAQIILCTKYQQMGWGDRVQFGCVDKNGTVWTVSYDSAYGANFPYKIDEVIDFVSKPGVMENMGTLSHDALFTLESLVYNTEDQGTKMRGAANDAGLETSYAVTYDKNGEATYILLGASGDSVFENLDPDAQALYLDLRILFPNVTSYASLGYGMGLGMGPVGFMPVPIWEYCGYSTKNLSTATVKGYMEDCEEGPIPLELTQEQQQTIINLAMNGYVTGKINAISQTGGFYSYVLVNENDEYLVSLSFCDGLLYLNDGMYGYEFTKPALPTAEELMNPKYLPNNIINAAKSLGFDTAA